MSQIRGLQIRGLYEVGGGRHGLKEKKHAGRCDDQRVLVMVYGK